MVSSIDGILLHVGLGKGEVFLEYQYNPGMIGEYGKDRMRFELGDTLVAGGEATCALCDEEYLVMLESLEAEGWLGVKVAILSAILHKLSFQVDTKVDSLQYDFSTRMAQWEQLYETCKRELDLELACRAVPSMYFSGRCHFWDGIHDNGGRWRF